MCLTVDGKVFTRRLTFKVWFWSDKAEDFLMFSGGKCYWIVFWVLAMLVFGIQRRGKVSQAILDPAIKNSLIPGLVEFLFLK